jgi:hypothetical protein
MDFHVERSTWIDLLKSTYKMLNIHYRCICGLFVYCQPVKKSKYNPALRIISGDIACFYFRISKNESHFLTELFFTSI